MKDYLINIEENLLNIAENLHNDFLENYFDNVYELIVNSDLFVAAQKPEEEGIAVIYVHYSDGNIDFKICVNTIEAILQELKEVILEDIMI